MPNWIVHTGAAAGGGALLPGRWRFLPFFMLGSVLPDTAAVAYITMLDLGWFAKLSPEVVLWYFQPYHTPFLSLLYSGAG